MSSITLEYKEIYSRFISKVEAYDLTELVDEDAYNLLSEYLHSIRAIPKVRKLFSKLTFNQEKDSITFELNNSFDPSDDDYNSDFVCELFGLGMAWKWVTPKYFSSLNTSQVYGGKEEKYYSQANHMDALENMYNNAKKEFYAYIRESGYESNSYLNSSGSEG